MFSLFKREKDVAVKQPKKPMQRGFVGARNSAMAKFSASYAKINAELKSDYIALTVRARDLAKNNTTVSSFLQLMIRNIIGANGFSFMETAYNDDHTADRIANDTIESAWYDYTTSFRKYVSADEQMNAIDFDKHILFTLLVDGECFIRKIKDPKSKYGIRFEVLDSLDVDTLYNVDFNQAKERICMGVKIDEHFKPLSYFVRKNRSTDYYLAGERIEIPASEIIHLYRKQYAGQVRGFTPLASVIQQLAGLETYKTAEINASLLNSAYMGIWEKTGSGDAYDQYSEDEVDANGDVASELETNVFRFAPDGYTLKNIQSNHPNSNVGAFFKAMLKGVASALGLSYNTMTSDYEATSYSSLRAAFLEDISTYKEWQCLLISNWKNIQYAEWLKYFLLSGMTNLPFSKYEKFLIHEFRGCVWSTIDPLKDIQNVQLKLSLGLSDPITELESLGKDADDVLDKWQLWNEKLKARGLRFDEATKQIADILTIEEEEQLEAQSNPQNNEQ